MTKDTPGTSIDVSTHGSAPETIPGVERTAAPAVVDPMTALLGMADRLDADAMERMVALVHREQDRRAEAAITEAIAEFQATCPPIPHSKSARIATSKGGSFSYTYAELPTIAETIRAPLAACGLSYTWDHDVADDLSVAVTCTLRHVDGGVRTSTFRSPMDDRDNRATSTAQKVKGLVTFGQRVSLIGVLGITTADSDTDGRRAPTRAPADDGTITKAQVAELQKLVDITGNAARDQLLDWAGVDTLGAIPRAKYDDIHAALTRRANAAKETTDA